MKIKTSELKDLLSKAIKGASCNKMIVKTEIAFVHAINGEIFITTTDNQNYLTVKGSCECEGDLLFSVNVTLLNNLVCKITSSEVEIIKEEKNLLVKGNGKYKLPLSLDENGKEIGFDLPLMDNSSPAIELNKVSLEIILRTNKAAISTSLAEPCYTGYYLGKGVITTDSYKICYNDITFCSTPMLINAEMMELTSLLGDTINLIVNENNYAFISSDNGVLIEGPLMDCIDEFKVDTIKSLIDKEFNNKLEVNRQSLIDALNRVNIFVSPFDKNNVKISVTKDGLKINSLQTDAEELLRYAVVNEVKPFDFEINITLLLKQLEAQHGENVELWYGNDNSIKMKDGTTTQVLALGVD